MLSQVIPDSQISGTVLSHLATALKTGALRAYWLLAPNGQKAGVATAQLTTAGAEKLFYINALLMANNVTPEAWAKAAQGYLIPHAKSLGCTHLQFDSTPDNKAINAIAKMLGASCTFRYTVEL